MEIKDITTAYDAIQKFQAAADKTGAADKKSAIVLTANGESIKVSTTDKPGFFGKLRRSQEDADINNDTRKTFMTALKFLLNVKSESDVAKKIGEDLKLKDFGSKGRPLSAFRIKTILKKASVMFAPVPRPETEYLDKAVKSEKVDDKPKYAEVGNDPEFENLKSRSKEAFLGNTINKLKTASDNFENTAEVLCGEFKNLLTFLKADHNSHGFISYDDKKDNTGFKAASTKSIDKTNLICERVLNPKNNPGGILKLNDVVKKLANDLSTQKDVYSAFLVEVLNDLSEKIIKEEIS